jgi:Bacterial PH domain
VATQSEAGHFHASLGRRQRLIAGVAIAIGFGGPFLFSVVLVATSGEMSLLILPLPFLGGLWVLQGLAPSGYTLEPTGLRLERRWMSRLLPYPAVLGCDRRRRAIGGLLALGLNGLFGSHGWRWNWRTGWHYLAITNTDHLVFLETAGGLVVISPSQPDAFAAELGRRLIAPGPRR